MTDNKNSGLVPLHEIYPGLSPEERLTAIAKEMRYVASLSEITYNANLMLRYGATALEASVPEKEYERVRDVALARTEELFSAEAKIDALQRVIDGYDRTPAEARAHAAEAKLDRIRDAYAESVDDELSYNLSKILEEDS